MCNKKEFLVYVITNKINSLKYVGITTQGLKERFSAHVRSSKKPNPKTFIARAINKYGRENFKIELLDSSASNSEELVSLESSYIISLNTLSPNGYNLIVKRNDSYEWSDCAKKQLSEKWNNFLETPEGQARMKEMRTKIRNGQRTPRNKGPNCCLYRGVLKSGNRYVFAYHVGGENKRKKQQLFFKTQEEAAIAYDLYFYKKYGDEAFLNFPENKIKYKNNEITVIPLHKDYCKSKGVNRKQRKNTKITFCIKKTAEGKTKEVYYSSEQEAALAYDIEQFKTKGENGDFNFPQNIEGYKNNFITVLSNKEKRKLANILH